MDLTLTQAEEAFRDQVRSWLGENNPGPEPEGEEAKFLFRRDWQQKMHEAGWAGISWPKEYGGRGASLIEQAIFSEEMARQRHPPPRTSSGWSWAARWSSPTAPRSRRSGSSSRSSRRGDLVPGVL